MWIAQAERYSSGLSPEHRELFYDNKSPVSYAWMLALPLKVKPSLKLRNEDISVGITTRALNPGFMGVCGCGCGFRPSHDLSCQLKKSYRTSRHEVVKRYFASVYKECHCSVTTEPVSENNLSRDRGDLSVQGPAALSGYSILDFSIVSPVSESAINVDARPLKARLEERFVEKMTHYQNQFQRGEFYPVVMSVGGTFHPVASKVVRMIIDGGKYSLSIFCRELSVVLLKVRTDYWYAGLK
jgi:hypothetical protein